MPSDFNMDLDLHDNSLLNCRVENVASLPTASSAMKGRQVYLTQASSEHAVGLYLCDGSSWSQMAQGANAVERKTTAGQHAYTHNGSVEGEIAITATVQETGASDSSLPTELAVRTALDKKTDSTMATANGTSKVSNVEGESGAVMTWIASNNKTKSALAVNDSDVGGPSAQIYAIDPSQTNVGSKLNIRKGGIYYLKNKATPATEDSADEIAVKGDVDAKITKPSSGTAGQVLMLDTDASTPKWGDVDGVKFVEVALTPTSTTEFKGTVSTDDFDKLKARTHALKATVSGTDYVLDCFDLYTGTESGEPILTGMLCTGSYYDQSTGDWSYTVASFTIKRNGGTDNMFAFQKSMQECIPMLGNEAVSEEPYKFPYYFSVAYQADKAVVTDYTVTLDGNEATGTYDLPINAATSATAGLMTATDKTKLDKALTTDNIKATLTETTEGNVLDATMGKELEDQIKNLKSMQKFLSTWDCTTGLPVSNPPTTPYSYTTGDFYRISKVAATATDDLIPVGSSYTGAASTTHYSGTETPAVGDYYFYDGTSWIFQTAVIGDKVVDVQIDGESVVQAGVASIKTDATPTASSKNLMTSGSINTYMSAFPQARHGTITIGQSSSVTITLGTTTGFAGRTDVYPCGVTVMDSTGKVQYCEVSLGLGTITITSSRELTNAIIAYVA